MQLKNRERDVQQDVADLQDAVFSSEGEAHASCMRCLKRMDQHFSDLVQAKYRSTDPDDEDKGMHIAPRVHESGQKFNQEVVCFLSDLV